MGLLTTNQAVQLSKHLSDGPPVRAAPSDPRARGFGSVTGGCAVARWFELVLARRRCRRQQAIGSLGRTQPRTRGPSDRPPPPAAPRSGRVSNRLATPKVAGQTRCLQMWSGRLTLPRPDETCHNVKDPGNQEALAASAITQGWVRQPILRSSFFFKATGDAELAAARGCETR